MILTVRTPEMIRLMTVFSSLIAYVLINLLAVLENLKFHGLCFLFRDSWSLLVLIKLVTKFITFDEFGITNNSSA